MASLTFNQALTDSAWTEIADGDEDGQVGFQVGGGGVALLLSDTAPAIDDNNYVILNSREPSFSGTLIAGFKAYARALHGSASIRGYRMPAA